LASSFRLCHAPSWIWLKKLSIFCKADPERSIVWFFF
jgi:hypothetical protein